MGKTSATLAGAGTGAAIGTAIMPGIGTAVGAIGGGLIGYLGSSKDKEATPYTADPNAYRYGANMSGVGNEQVQQYDQQGANLRTGATAAQQRGMHEYGAQQYANNAANNANYAVGNQSQINAARAQQLAAYGRQQQGDNALASFAQQPQGPSAAEAQLKAGANLSFAQQLAAARSGGNAGGQANALRGAAFQQAGIMGQENAQAAQVRAQEGQAYKQQQLQALGMAQQGYGAEAATTQGLRGADLNTAQLQAQTQLQAGQLQGNTALSQGNQFLQNRAQNDQFALGQGQLAGQQDQLTQNVYGQQLQANMQEQQLNSQNYNAAMQANMQAQNANNAGMMGMATSGFGMAGNLLSDSREKRDKVRAEGAASALAALGYPRVQQGGQYGQDPTGKYQIESDASEFGAPRSAAYGAEPPAMRPSVPTARFADVQTDLRGVPAYQYRYRDPNAPGAAPGQQLGPMAQDLEANPATAGAVRDTPRGKVVDAGRIAMTTVPAIGEQQRRTDAHDARISDLERQLAAYRGAPRGAGDEGLYGINANQLVDLDEANERARAYR